MGSVGKCREPTVALFPAAHSGPTSHRSPVDRHGGPPRESANHGGEAWRGLMPLAVVAARPWSSNAYRHTHLPRRIVIMAEAPKQTRRFGSGLGASGRSWSPRESPADEGRAITIKYPSANVGARHDEIDTQEFF
jgi:hypothetical protein